MGFNKRLYGMGKSGRGGSSGSGRGNSSGSIVAVRAETFFDRAPVISALEKKYRSVMARLGGFIRTTMQRSMRKRNRSSKPGEPPTSWRQSKGGAGALRALTEFGYDKRDQTLVIGPQLISSPTKALGGKSVPQLINEGGDAIISSFGGNRVMAHFEARPFVEPAVETGTRKLAELLETVPLIQTKGR